MDGTPVCKYMFLFNVDLLTNTDTYDETRYVIYFHISILNLYKCSFHFDPASDDKI